MTPERGALFTTTLFIVLVAVASGPLVPAADLTADGDFPDTMYRTFAGDEEGLGVEHRLSFAAEPLPRNGTLTRAGDEYAVAVPDATLAVETGAEAVTVRYAVRVPALDYERSAVRRLPAGERRSVAVSVPAGTVAADAVEDGSYEAHLVVTVTQGDRTFVAADGDATLEVRE